MSLPAQPIAPIPDETRRVAEAAFPDGNLYMQMRDLLGTIYTDEMFANLYPEDGHPALRPWRLALITVMQFCEKLTDRQAADAVRDRVTWKYALSLALTDSGFNFSVLSEFRQRLLAHESGQQLLDEMLEVLRDRSLLKSHQQQRTDSTHIIAAIKKRNQLELVHETLRYTLNEMARHEPEWVKSWVPEVWFERYSKRTSNYLLPKDETERQAWSQQVGQDGITLLEKLYQHRDQSGVELPAVVNIMQQIWIQNYYYKENVLYLREKEDQPPSSRRIASPYDTEARYSTKRETQWVGYKVHLTETCETNSPHFITHVETRPATEPDSVLLEGIHAALAQRDCLPQQHLVDQGYTSVELMMNSRENYHIEMIGLIPDDNSWQARKGGYDSSRFSINWEQQQAICPQGHLSCSWSLAYARGHRLVAKIKFRQRDCTVCSMRSLCTHNQKSKRRTLTIMAPQSHYEAQQVARQQQQTQDFKDRYAARAGVEGTISQAAFALGTRRTRYRGMVKTHLQHLATACAINLMRGIDWLNEVPHSTTPISHFARLIA